jgi:hypothetical protein
MSKHSNDDFFKVLNSMSGKSEFIDAVNKLFGFEKADEPNDDYDNQNYVDYTNTYNKTINNGNNVKIDNTLIDDYINAINEAANKKLKQIEEAKVRIPKSAIQEEIFYFFKNHDKIKINGYSIDTYDLIRKFAMDTIGLTDNGEMSEEFLDVVRKEVANILIKESKVCETFVNREQEAYLRGMRDVITHLNKSFEKSAHDELKNVRIINSDDKIDGIFIVQYAPENTVSAEDLAKEMAKETKSTKILDEKSLLADLKRKIKSKTKNK